MRNILKQLNENNDLKKILIAVAIGIVLIFLGYMQKNRETNDLIQQLPSPANTNNTETPSTQNSQPTATEVPKPSIEGGLCPDSTNRILTESDLYGKNGRELDIMRNEIYARHGRPFKLRKFQDFFKTQTWYHLNTNYNDGLLNEFEKRNASFIYRYQEQHKLWWEPYY